MINELSQQKMNVLEEIANSNMLVSNLKSQLASLNKEKDDFFIQKEKDIKQQISCILNDSHTILEETKQNYKHVHDFYEVLKGYSDFLVATHNSLKESVDNFNKNTEIERIELSSQVESLSKLEKNIKIDSDGIKKDKQFINQKHIEIINEKKLIESRQEQIKSALQVLKNKTLLDKNK